MNDPEDIKNCADLYFMYWCHIRHCLFIESSNSLNKLIMKKNMGSADRIIRVVVAIILGILYFTGTVTGTLGIILLVIGAVFLLTSLVSFCPLYLPFGLSTCK